MKWLSLIYLLLSISVVYSQVLPKMPAKVKEKATPPKKHETAKHTPVHAAGPVQAIKFFTDADAYLYVDGEKRGQLKPGAVLKLALPKGQYLLKAESVQNSMDYVSETYDVTETGNEVLHQIRLQAVINKRQGGEKLKMQQQAAAEKAKQQEENQKQAIINMEAQLEMISVEGGKWKLKSKHFEKSINISSFLIGKFEVTQKQWTAVGMNVPFSIIKCDNCPIYNLSWSEIKEFIIRLNRATGKHYSLPSDAEWEFAAFGGNQSRGYLYSGSHSVNEVAWYVENSGGKVHSVGSKIPNELGVFDMSGNVGELCLDWYEYYYCEDCTNRWMRILQVGSGADISAIRGGGYNSSVESIELSVKSPEAKMENIKLSTFGFRLVHSL